MTTLKKNFVVGMAAAGLVLSGAATALARSPSALTDRQLDSVTAGGAVFVATSTDAAAVGVLALTQVTGNSVAGAGASPYPGNPELGPSFGVAVGTALAVGTNLGQQNQPPASSGTNVTTGGSANGNFVVNSTVNQTVQGAGGVTFQAGWTFVYGAWIGL